MGAGDEGPEYRNNRNVKWNWALGHHQDSESEPGCRAGGDKSKPYIGPADAALPVYERQDNRGNDCDPDSRPADEAAVEVENRPPAEYAGPRQKKPLKNKNRAIGGRREVDVCVKEKLEGNTGP